MTAKNGNISVVLKVVLALAVLAAAGYFALQRFADIAIVDEVTRGEAVNAVPGSVTVYADKGIRELKSLLGGRVVECKLLDPGKEFKKGDVLLQLDTTDLKREIAEAKRNFDSNQEKRKLLLKANTDRIVAEAALKNAKRLYDRNDIAKDKLDEIQRAFDAVESKIAIEEFENNKLIADYNAAKELKEDLVAKMSVLAPEDGVISGSTMWEGALINPGSTIATFTSAKRQVKAKISEEKIGAVALGQEAEVMLLSYPGQKFKAKVSKLIAEADETQRFEVYLDVEAKPGLLQHNQTGQTTITVDRHPNQALVPRRAIFNGNNVFVVKNGKVELREIQVGFISLNRVEVVKGLEQGELVIVEGIDTFRKGQNVRIEKSK